MPACIGPGELSVASVSVQHINSEIQSVTADNITQGSYRSSTFNQSINQSMNLYSAEAQRF